MTGKLESDVSLDLEGIREFWERRAQKSVGGVKVGLSNLEPDPARYQEKIAHEAAVLDDFVAVEPGYTVLDLGAGHGFWAARYAAVAQRIECVEFSPAMVRVAESELRALGIKNVQYHCMPAQDFRREQFYDVVLISGLLIYLSPADVAQLLGNLASMTRPGARAVLRDGTARDQNYLIDHKYSEALEDQYSAYYRTAGEYIDLFESSGFELLRDRDMFDQGSLLNKWSETVLRVYEFRKRGGG